MSSSSSSSHPLSPSFPLSPASLVLRTSCDGCAAAKVKCDKSHPRCTRCVSSNVECIYGISRKHGRSNARALHGSASRHSQGVTRRSGNHHRRLNLSPRPPLQWSGEAPTSVPLLSMSTLGYDRSFNTEGHVDEMNCQFEDLAGLFSIGTQLPPSCDRNNSELDALDLSLSGISGQSASDTRNPSDAGISSSVVHNYGCSAGESCYSKVHSSLDMLNSYQSAYSTSLDDVLSRNRGAVHSVTHLLDCLCSKEPQLAMLCSAALERVLNSYQDAHRFVYSKSPLEDAQQLSPPPSEHSAPINMQFSRNSVDSVPVRANDLDLDEEDQETMRRLLLLSELRKVGKIIDRFSSKALDSTHDVGRAGDIYTMLGMWLRKELQEAMQHFKTKS